MVVVISLCDLQTAEGFDSNFGSMERDLDNRSIGEKKTVRHFKCDVIGNSCRLN